MAKRSHSRAIGASPGLDRLVLYVLAVQCSPKGVVSVSIRDMALRCGVSRAQIVKALGQLQETGEIRIAAKGGGKSAPNKYQIAERYIGPPAAIRTEMMTSDTTVPPDPAIPVQAPLAAAPLQHDVSAPEPLPKPALGVSDEHDVQCVSRVIEAAGVKPPAGQPLFWWRVEHRLELVAEMRRRNIPDVPTLIEQIKTARANGGVVSERARSMRAVLSIPDTNGGARVKT